MQQQKKKEQMTVTQYPTCSLKLQICMDKLFLKTAKQVITRAK